MKLSILIFSPTCYSDLDLECRRPKNSSEGQLFTGYLNIIFHIHTNSKIEVKTVPMNTKSFSLNPGRKVDNIKMLVRIYSILKLRICSYRLEYFVEEYQISLLTNIYHKMMKPLIKADKQPTP